MIKIQIRYFEPYKNSFVTRDFYAVKPQLKIHEVPKDNNTDNIVYEPFTIEVTGYEDIEA